MTRPGRRTTAVPGPCGKRRSANPAAKLRVLVHTSRVDPQEDRYSVTSATGDLRRRRSC
jgi:hypothetical protein